MNPEYTYIRERSRFGRFCLFNFDGPNLLDDIQPQKDLSDLYIVKAFVNKGIQISNVVSEHEANTSGLEFEDRGMFHEQGGWPKELNITDDEAVLRYKKKLEREDNYIQAMKMLSRPIEHAVLQNNALNIYQKYFSNSFLQYSETHSFHRIKHSYHYTNSIPRPVSYLSWSHSGTAFATSYCNTKFQGMAPEESTEANVWSLENPCQPIYTFDSNIPILSLEWNQIDHNILIGGLYNGLIACYDLRKGPSHVNVTTPQYSHRAPVNSVLWTASKSGSEFFSTSSDGTVKWWDYRYLKKTSDEIILDLSRNQNINNSYPASCLEYDSSIPVKYLVGTDNGYIIGGNRKGVSLTEKLQWVIKSHLGSVNSLERNAAFSKFFLSVGAWQAKIFSEDCKESPIIWTPHCRAALTAGGWSKSRYSVFFVTRSDGLMDAWDLLLSHSSPVVSMKISERPLTALRLDEKGKLAVVGDSGGKIHLVEFGENLMSTQKNDKPILSAMFERENRREKILETRMKEIRLALKLKAQQHLEAAEKHEDDMTETLKKVDEYYWGEVHSASK